MGCGIYSRKCCSYGIEEEGESEKYQRREGKRYTCSTLLHVVHYYMQYIITCSTLLHVVHYYMQYIITCSTLLHVVIITCSTLLHAVHYYM